MSVLSLQESDARSSEDDSVVSVRGPIEKEESGEPVRVQVCLYFDDNLQSFESLLFDSFFLFPKATFSKDSHDLGK